MSLMDLQDILKLIKDASFANLPLFTEFIGALAISSTKEDPIDQKEAYYNDALNYFEKITTAFIHQYAGFFDKPDFICEAFQRAIIAEKLRVHQQVMQAKKKRGECPACRQ